MKARNFYNDLMQTKKDFQIYNLSEGMQVAYDKVSGPVYLINLRERFAWQVVDQNRKLVMWSEKDINWKKMKCMDKQLVSQMYAPYSFTIGCYNGGVAKVTWCICPSNECFADNQDFWMVDDAGMNMVAYIDNKAQVFIPFQP